MAIKRWESIAEYAMRRWMEDHGFIGGCFSLVISGNEGIVRDTEGSTLILEYDSHNRCVYVRD